MERRTFTTLVEDEGAQVVAAMAGVTPAYVRMIANRTKPLTWQVGLRVEGAVGVDGFDLMKSMRQLGRSRDEVAHAPNPTPAEATQ